MIPRRELIIGFTVLLILLGVLTWAANRQIGSWLVAEEPPHVVKHLVHEEIPYLLWSNGQITPDMVEQRKFVIRAISAQAVLEKQQRQ